MSMKLKMNVESVYTSVTVMRLDAMRVKKVLRQFLLTMYVIVSTISLILTVCVSVRCLSIGCRNISITMIIYVIVYPKNTQQNTITFNKANPVSDAQKDVHAIKLDVCLVPQGY